MEEVETISRDIDSILACGGFSAKPLHRTGQPGKTSILGMSWDKGEDTLSISLRFNPSAKRKGIHVESDTPLEGLEECFPSTLTRR